MREDMMTRITLRMPDLELPLTLDTQHPASSSGLGVLVLPDGVILDGERFRGAHARGATILTDAPERVAEALGVPWQADLKEPRIVELE
jgi:hypothetical protein